ncbi:peptidase M4 family protein [Rubrivivax gelatinosus]|nr:peptidase M4 family protein [Rubrivivax gelatinosus]
MSTFPSRHGRIARTAVAAAIVLAAGSAGAAPSAERAQAAGARALAQVQAFPGRTLHGAGQSWAVRNVVVDADGREHVRLDRRFRGLRVIGGDVVMHASRSGAFEDASLTLRRTLALDIQPRRSAGDALRAAIAAHSGALRGKPELVVHARGDSPVLAWDVLLDGEAEDGTPSERHVIVDAATAQVLESWDDVQTAPAAGSGKALFLGTVPLTTETSGSGYVLKDTTRGGQNTVDMKNRGVGKGTAFNDADNVWGSGSTADRATVAVDAQYGIAMTWDYFKNVHGRNGIADNGVGAQSRVHYKRNYANAFWSDSCFCMTFGDGNSSIHPLVSLDVAAHEMSHGVTSRTAGLVYSGESGGLNEATSDIFGTMVEFYAANANDTPDYLMGEKLFKNGSGVIRSMIQPSSDGASADCWYSGLSALDVHYSSGVANHFFFLLAAGTTAGQPSRTCSAGNTRVANGSGTLAGIGNGKAEKIWYRALTVYMTSSTNYAAARSATLKAAADLYGAGSAEVDAVAAAWTAVNVN